MICTETEQKNINYICNRLEILIADYRDSNVLDKKAFYDLIEVADSMDCEIIYKLEDEPDDFVKVENKTYYINKVD